MGDCPVSEQTVVNLTPAQSAVLETLRAEATSTNDWLSRREIARKAGLTESRVIDVHISHLRTRAGYDIEALRHKGWRLLISNNQNTTESI